MARQTSRQTDEFFTRQTNIQLGKQTDIERDRQTDKWQADTFLPDREAYRQTDRLTDR